MPDKAKDEYSHRLPHFLPTGRGVLFTIISYCCGLQSRLALLDLGTGKWRVVMEDAADGRYVRTGHLVFLRLGTLMAAAFDLDRMEVQGQPVPIVANVMQALNVPHFHYSTAAGQYSVSNSGWLAYVPGGILPDREDSLMRVDLKGNVQPIGDWRADLDNARFSPDGHRIAYGTAGSQERLWIYDLDRGTKSRLTGDGWASELAWTPDGKRLVFGWFELGRANLYWQSSNGSSPMERLTIPRQFSVFSGTPFAMPSTVVGKDT